MIIHFATQEQLDEFKKSARREIADALGKVPGPFVPMQFGAPLLTERTKDYDFALFARFKDRTALDAYAVSDEHTSVVNNVIRPRTELEETIDYDLEIPDDTW
ncbi:hypothetical protein BN14_07465 [Rhizoctonia solani AG-1 IB]|uniref:Stress-response A/B barrel domain-containing protein n=1 Tax=Thanatephorus cucumeris (strain AG1-IB / isolate 7/3/14) TaxID=1108050 RepID=M5C2Y2_THACB|nr:hypothetical protein BN14_07465 [Rhizoctonia solani AG-1 IB]